MTPSQGNDPKRALAVRARAVRLRAGWCTCAALAYYAQQGHAQQAHNASALLWAAVTSAPGPGPGSVGVSRRVYSGFVAKHGREV